MFKEVTPAHVAAVYPVSSLKKIENKRRKGKGASGSLWNEILQESLETDNPETQPVLIEHATDKTKDQSESARALNTELKSEPEPEEMINEIRRIAGGSPERLFESHVSVFIEPVHPGRWVDSLG